MLKLDPDASNWADWKNRTLATLCSHSGVTRHLKGTARVPDELPVYSSDLVLRMTRDEEELKRLEERYDKYHACENLIKAHLFDIISPELRSKVHGLPTAAAMWKAICDEYESNQMVKTNLRTKLQLMQCAEDGDVAAHLDEMIMIHWTLKSMDYAFDDSTFTGIIVGSLPRDYYVFLLSVMVTAGINKKQILSGDVINKARDEYARRCGEAARLKNVENAPAAGSGKRFLGGIQASGSSKARGDVEYGK